MAVKTQEKVIYRNVVGLFNNRHAADAAWGAALGCGCSPDELTVAVSEDSMPRHFILHEDAVGEKTLEGAAVGGALGIAAGAVGAALAAAGAAVLIPGIGIAIAGPLAATFVGAGAGGAVGGVLGAFVGAGISDVKAKQIQNHLDRGGIVLAVRTPSATVADLVEAEWKSRAVNVIR